MTNLAGIEHDGPTSAAVATEEPRAAALLPRGHYRLIAVTFVDDTDHHNELVQEREWILHRQESLRLSGNLFIIEGLLDGRGTLFVRSAPLPHARPQPCEWDLRIDTNAWGDHFAIHLEGDAAQWTQLAFDGGRRGAGAALQAWQRSLRPSTPIHRQPRFITNTWGDRNRDARINHDFVMAELEAAAAIGADALQIDDGWQSGRSGNTADPAGGASSNFRAEQPEFWTVDRKRFPQGFAPLLERGRALGIELGLWFAPDRADGHAAWQADAETLLGLHREHGICMFKIDFVDTTSQTGLDNFAKLSRAVREGSKGAIHLEIDCTAGRRPGYFGVADGAPLFIENRYTDWTGYWPHLTLRNTWSLARWIDPLRLRMEFLNPRRNQDKYGDDPLAPARYRADSLLATVLAANPLGWFESSELEATDAEAIAALATVWRAHREAMAACFIDPIGQRPDGLGISGFHWWQADNAAGYLLLLRGCGCQDTIDLALDGVTATEPLAGEATVTVDDGRLTISNLPALGYCLLRLS